MSYVTDWVDYDSLDPLNPNAIPKANDLNRIEQGIADIDSEIGDLENLETTDKTNLVGAINELKEVTDTGNTNMIMIKRKLRMGVRI